MVVFVIAAASFGYFKYEQINSKDNQAPAITMDTDSIQVSCQAEDGELLKGIKATDSKDGDVTGSLIVESVSNFMENHTRNMTVVAFDSDNHATKAARKITYADGKIWLHTGDIGYVDEDGVFYVLNRGAAHRFGGGELAVLPMENRLADAKIKGIKDEFFVLIEDEDHDGYFVPYLYVVLEDGYSVEDITEAVQFCLEPYMFPVEILAIDERPFFHFKTNRIELSKELKKKSSIAE